MNRVKQGRPRSIGATNVSRLDAFITAIFSGDRFAFFAFGLVSAIFTLELAMNLRNAVGWVAVAHLLIVGPLWLACTGLTVFALVRHSQKRLLTRAAKLPERE